MRQRLTTLTNRVFQNRTTPPRKPLLGAIIAFALVGAALLVYTKAAAPTYNIYFGYISAAPDGYGTLLDPWVNSPNVNFVGIKNPGCCVAEDDTSGWDSGAVMIENLTDADFEVYVSVSGMQNCNRDWPRSVVPARGKAIFTQTGSITGEGEGLDGYWDTSDIEWACTGANGGNSTCESNLDGVIHVEVNGVTKSFADSTDVLTAQKRRAECNVPGVPRNNPRKEGQNPAGTETIAWTLIGNDGDGSGGPVPTQSPGGWRTYPDSHAAIQYLPGLKSGCDDFSQAGWALCTGQDGYFDNSYHYTNNLGGAFEFQFNGTGVRIYSDVSDHAGRMDVAIDGVAQGVIDYYSAAFEKQVKVYEKTGLAGGNHTFKATLTGQNSASSGTFVGLDQVQIEGVLGTGGSGPTPTTAPTAQPTATPTGTSNPGDITGDGHVNFQDLSVLIRNYKKAVSARSDGDLDGDGTVTILDLSRMVKYWGT